MPLFRNPSSTPYSTPAKVMTVGKDVFSFGSDNLKSNPAGPAAPSAPTLSVTANASANIAGTVYSQVVYVFPGSSPAQVNPQTLPMGFASAQSNIAVLTGNAVVVTSPTASSDLDSIAIGYNVFAGYTANTANLINTDYVIPIGTNYTITNSARLLQNTGQASTQFSSPTNSFSYEAAPTANTAGLQHAIPVGGSNFLGTKNISFRTAFANAAVTSANIQIQVAYQDGPNNYTTIATSNVTANVGDYQVIPNINAKFVRAYVANLAPSTAQLAVALRVD